jgi:biopolymer transport protein ExbD
MGDESVPYALLKKVMTTCAAADYRKISLAVTKIASAATAEAVEG